MHKFEYEIKLNENDRPYISIPDSYTDNPEDKFMALELTRYIVQRLIDTRKDILDENSLLALEVSLKSLTDISDEVAAIIRKTMEHMGDVAMIMSKNYHIQVNTIEERDKLNYKGIIRDDKIFKRIEGLRVLVTSENKIFELRGGIDNENWKEL